MVVEPGSKATRELEYLAVRLYDIRPYHTKSLPEPETRSLTWIVIRAAARQQHRPTDNSRLVPDPPSVSSGHLGDQRRRDVPFRRIRLTWHTVPVESSVRVDTPPASYLGVSSEMNSGLGRIPEVSIRPVVLVVDVVMLGIPIRVTRLPFVLPQDGKAGFLRGKLRASLYLGFLVLMATPNGSRGVGDGVVGRDGFPSVENGFGLEAGQ
jgi:hypothetical protein